MSVNVGDSVQIKAGGIDVTNGNQAIAGKMYGEGGPLWCKVESITNGWNTGSRWGLPSSVTKVRCSNNGVVVWQVRPEDISGQVINIPTNSIPTPVRETIPIGTETGKSDFTSVSLTYLASNNSSASNILYAPKENAELWTEKDGVTSGPNTNELLPTISSGVDTKIVTGRTPFTTGEKFQYERRGSWRSLNSKERRSIGSGNIQVDDSALEGAKTKTVFQNESKRRQLLNEDIENIQNSSLFPSLSQGAKGLIAAKYDYQIIPSDPRYPNITTLEDKLKTARASFGIPVHGNNEIARAMKYYLYNRFKTPDINLAHNKSFTYVFFTRPDLNIIDPKRKTVNNQCLNHTETAMIWRRYPELFKLLSDCKRNGDGNNFNMLLSNQVTSFDIQDETITTIRAGKTWHEYEMSYGDSYTGRTAGEFSCNFTETSDYSILNMIKLWITYIDNVSKGAWSPSYNLFGDGMNQRNSSHVYDKTLDYAASAYVFKCGPDGEDVLYWTKYFGVFPVNTGANALTWDLTTPVGDTPKLNIRFSYSFKRDMNPISLIELNRITKITNSQNALYEEAYNGNYGHVSRPYVGAPFIAMKLGSTELTPNGVKYDKNRTQIRLKFQKNTGNQLSDDLLYKFNMNHTN